MRFGGRLPRRKKHTFFWALPILGQIVFDIFNFWGQKVKSCPNCVQRVEGYFGRCPKERVFLSGKSFLTLTIRRGAGRQSWKRGKQK